MQITNNYNLNQLQLISVCCAVLRACEGVQPFSLAIKINNCGLAADAALRIFNEELNLIKEREKETQQKDLVQNDMTALMSKTYAVHLPVLRTADFEQLQISGEKAVQQPDGSVQFFSYREAYFNLLNVGVIIK